MSASHASIRVTPRCPEFLRGSFVPLPTPFRGDRFDREDLARLVEWHVEAGSHGLVVAGTSGEAATLTPGERIEVIQATVALAARRLPVLAGVGTNSTAGTVSLAAAAERAGADGLLVVTPYYNCPGPRGLAAHFAAIARATALPIMLYNVPSRTASDLVPDAVRETVAEHENLVAVKEAMPDVARVGGWLELGLRVFCGCDERLASFVAAGAEGAVSVTANPAPALVAELLAVAAAGDRARADELERALEPLVRDLFVEVNPVPLKAAMAFLLGTSPEVRLPLVPLLDANRRRLERTLRAVGLRPSATATARARAT